MFSLGIIKAELSQYFPIVLAERWRWHLVRIRAIALGNCGEGYHGAMVGLDVHFLPAPSDATDSVTIWFPALNLAVNNLLWPALFNVFAIRGEEYRDPRILLRGLEHLPVIFEK